MSRRKPASHPAGDGQPLAGVSSTTRSRRAASATKSSATPTPALRTATACTSRGCWSPPPAPVVTAHTASSCRETTARRSTRATWRPPAASAIASSPSGSARAFTAKARGRAKMANQVAPGGKTFQQPSCTSCHQGHEIRLAASARFRRELPNLCGNCHADLSSRYAMSIHGELTELGYQPAANCFDCHGSHSIQAVNNPASSVAGRSSPGDLPEVPPLCHRQLRPIRSARQLQRSQGQPRRLLGVPGAADAAAVDVRLLRAARRILVRARHCRGLPRRAAERVWRPARRPTCGSCPCTGGRTPSCCCRSSGWR